MMGWVARLALQRALRNRKKPIWWFFLLLPLVGMLALILLVAAVVGTSQASCVPSMLPVSTGTGALSYSQLEGLWIQGGGPTATAPIAAAIALAESSGKPEIQQGQPYATTGWGYWQITPGNSEPQYGIDQALLVPINNARAAVAKYIAAAGFAPWTTYNDGAYQQYMNSTSPQPVSLTTGACSPLSVDGYVNPLAHLQNLVPERVDMGVDYSGTGEIDAIGGGLITNTAPNGWPGTAFIDEQLTGGTYAGKFWYAAECITPSVQVGQTVVAGQPIGVVTNCGSGIEIGWAVGPSTTTLAASLNQQCPPGQDPGCHSTTAGASASRFLQALGAPAGVMKGIPAGTLPPGYP